MEINTKIIRAERGCPGEGGVEGGSGLLFLTAPLVKEIDCAYAALGLKYKL